MSKTTAIRSVKQIVNVLLTAVLPLIVREPQSIAEWDGLAKGFQDIWGFPNCCLAVDGSLFEIEHPYDYEGWYCRKGFPAINVQIVVDHKAKIVSFDMRPGSSNGKATFNYSDFGVRLPYCIPAGKHIVVDAGYALTSQMMIPYPVRK
jgi:hypothetical protein